MRYAALAPMLALSLAGAGCRASASANINTGAKTEQGDDVEPFEERMKRLTATLREQQAEAERLDAAIAANLKELGSGG